MGKDDDQPGNKGSFFQRLLFKEEYLAEKGIKPKEGDITTSTTTVTSNQVTQPQTTLLSDTELVAEMEGRVNEVLNRINQPGPDLYEVMVAADRMGGVNGPNLKSATIAIQALHPELTKQHILDSGQQYCTQLTGAMNAEIETKNSERDNLLKQKAAKSESIKNDIGAIEAEIKRLNGSLVTKRQELSNIDSEFDPQIKKIDSKINAGKTAAEKVVARIRSVMELVQQFV